MLLESTLIVTDDRRRAIAFSVLLEFALVTSKVSEPVDRESSSPIGQSPTAA